MTCRLLIEKEPHSGSWNMAFDEALLEAASRRGETILRIYRWREPTLSLGYFQKSVQSDLPASLKHLPRVRRLSGGGAILHHHEWTYSCSVPHSHRFAKKTEQLYDAAHGALVSALRAIGVDADLRGASPGQEAFLCFLRADARDIIVAGRKVVGSAQRRRRGAILQHGSVLLKASEHAPSVPGLVDLRPTLAYEHDLGVAEFVRAFGKDLFDAEPTTTTHPEDHDLTGKLMSRS